jgi:hypothetical protein
MVSAVTRYVVADNPWRLWRLVRLCLHDTLLIRCRKCRAIIVVSGRGGQQFD